MSITGVYIKGMEMPKNEPLLVKINPNGSVNTTVKNDYKKYEAIPVPPHGRLGDLDELLKHIREEGRNQAEFYADRHHPVVLAYGNCYGMVKDAPIIIPAEEEKNGMS